MAKAEVMLSDVGNGIKGTCRVSIVGAKEGNCDECIVNNDRNQPVRAKVNEAETGCRLDVKGESDSQTLEWWSEQLNKVACHPTIEVI